MIEQGVMNDPGAAPLPFSKRLHKRRLLWWGRPRTWRRLGDFTGPLRGLPLRFTSHSRDTPDEIWRRGPHWQRRLNNKWNSREFAQLHGCQVARLYWHGRRLSKLPQPLPEHFVVRLAWGEAKKQVYIFWGEREILRDVVVERTRLRRFLRQAFGHFSPDLILVEEFLRHESGRLERPVEVRCYMFGSTVAAIQCLGREEGVETRFYGLPWKAFESPLVRIDHPRRQFSPPACLDELLASSRRMGAEYQTFVRIDYYVTDHGCVFGEFSTVPGRGNIFTPCGNEYFGRVWEETIPDEI